MKSELKDLKELLTSSTGVIKTTACDALQIAQSNTKDILALKDELRAEFSGKINEMKEQCAMLKAENMILKNVKSHSKDLQFYYNRQVFVSLCLLRTKQSVLTICLDFFSARSDLSFIGFNFIKIIQMIDYVLYLKEGIRF